MDATTAAMAMAAMMAVMVASKHGAAAMVAVAHAAKCRVHAHNVCSALSSNTHVVRLITSSVEGHIPPYEIFRRILVAEIERC
jgi:hypothetical protein